METGPDVEHVILEKDVFIGDGCLLELTIAEATHLGTFCPHTFIEATRKVVDEDRAVPVWDNGAKAIPHEKAGNPKSCEEADDRDYGHPLLTRIFSLGPRTLNLAFPDASRVEVAVRESSLVNSSRGCVP